MTLMTRGSPSSHFDSQEPWSPGWRVILALEHISVVLMRVMKDVLWGLWWETSLHILIYHIISPETCTPLWGNHRRNISFGRPALTNWVSLIFPALPIQREPWSFLWRWEVEKSQPSTEPHTEHHVSTGVEVCVQGAWGAEKGPTTSLSVGRGRGSLSWHLHHVRALPF